MEIFVGDFALGYDVGGAGEEEVGDPGTVALYIDDELAARHVDFYAVSADFALQGQDGHKGTGSGSAGIGEIFHAALEGALIDMIFAEDFIEVDVGTLGEVLIPTDLAT